MTKIHVVELESAALFTLAALCGVVFAFYFSHKPQMQTSVSLPVINYSPSPTVAPTPQPTTTSQVSPDGTKKVVMVMTPHSLNTTYTFSVADSDGSNPVSIYSVNLPTGENMNIPYNSFSPGDTYVFLEHTTKAGVEALVFEANGMPFSDSEHYINATATFANKQTGNTYDTTTGWASDTLLIINASTPGGSRQSYWLEIPSKALIPLSTQF